MIYHKFWHERSRDGNEWALDGWFLLGFIPLYVRDRSSRGLYGYRRPAGSGHPQQPAVLQNAEQIS